MGIVSGIGKGAAKAGSKVRAANMARVRKLAEEEMKKAGRKGKSPVQNKPGVIKGKGYVAKEGAGVDPETGGSVDVARLVGTRGEKVSTGAGTRARGFVDEQATKGGRERAKRVVKLEEKREAGTLTKKESAELKRLNKADTDAAERQAGRTIASRQSKSEAQKKVQASKIDSWSDLIKYGVLPDNPKDLTINQLKIALRNVEARKELAAGAKNKSKRIIETLLEAKNQPKLSRPRRGLGQARGHGGPEIFAPKPRRRPMKHGGLIKKGHKDYRKGGMFY